MQGIHAILVFLITKRVVIESAGILLIALSVMVQLLLSYAHARVANADVLELQALQHDGLIATSPSLVESFHAVSELLDTVAPAVYMRQESWIHFYFTVLRCARVFFHPPVVERELTRVAAYQAAHYRVACARLASIQ